MSAKKSILVGIDYSPPCFNALREAARIANAADLSLICYHVLDQDILDEFKHHETYDENGILEFAYEKIEAFIRDVIGTAHDIEAFVKIGNPFIETLKLIKEHNPETLVLGSRGFGTIEPSTVGALASKCVRKAPVEVLLVRKNQDKPFHSIIACIDFSDNSIRAAYRAAEIARQDGAQLQLVHIYRPPIYADSDIGWLGPAFPMIQEPSILDNTSNRLEKLSYELGKKFDLQDISSVVHRDTSITRGIHKSSKEMNADLIVLGTRGRTGLKILLLGTTAESLIHSTPCSTLAVKPEGFTYSLD